MGMSESPRNSSLDQLYLCMDTAETKVELCWRLRLWKNRETGLCVLIFKEGEMQAEA